MPSFMNNIHSLLCVSIPSTLCTTDKPTAPEDLEVSEVFAETCKLSWKPPADDGGGAIAGTWNDHLTCGTTIYQLNKCSVFFF